ncbi:Rpn family recombination-promoting nuclease/putative transposase [Coprococcus catus]|uniref:Rpn family recombination-promoting nuclease/putative transposase n=1 Tax=Coprococcus catus TaxID=116085 RepID=A0A3E2XRZ8_9FIRM|nr:Rpn family recombination-promoting nuclease/putative transposase [Coprococcus catus]RGC51011.1 Rpn family recombination-promoting nuclease/putative transposase [Coprococcus catus]
MKKRLQDLTIKDAFMFAAVMSDEEQCRHLLELVLNTKILTIHVVTEKSITYHPEYHGVRLDVMAEEEGTRRRFNVEMQVKTEIALAKRSRYYHAQMDMDALLAGESYDQLADTYVIFICDFDPFGNRLYRYTIENRIQETGNALNDGSQTIILSTKGKNQSEVPVELVRFLQYVAQETDEAETEDDYVKMLQERIKSIKKNRDWEGKYMLLEEMMREERMEGMQEGIQKGQERINQLNILLSEQNRSEDIIKAATDRDYQERLFKEFHL